MPINISEIRPPLTGIKLIEALSQKHERRPALAEGFLYEHTITMIAADPGLGKSTIATQVAVELSAGLPVFGVFNVPKPIRVLYIQAERSIIEILERLDIINKIIPIVKENLYITDAYQSFNLVNHDHVNAFIKCIKRDCPNIEFIILDPIYAMVAGGLSNDLPASAFTKAMSRLQVETRAGIWYSHHTIKQQHTRDGLAIEKEDPFYGSQWLKAHVTGSYYMKKHENGVKLICKKDNYNLLVKSIHLDYDPETELCSIPTSEISALERVKNFIKMREIDQKEFTFSQIKDSVEVCNKTLRYTLQHPEVINKIIVVNIIKRKHLYKAKKQAF